MIGPKVLLFGPSGTGKTFTFGGVVEWAQANDYEVFALFVENGLETLLGYWRDVGVAPFLRKEPAPIPSCLHWHSELTRPLDMKALLDMADKVGKLSYEAITKSADPNRSANNAWWKVLSSCANFPDDRTGEVFGGFDSWAGKRRIILIDSLSELANACMKMVIGAKPTAAPPDYGVAQNNLLNFLRLLTQAVEAPVIMTAHVDRIQDEISGSTKIMVKSIGKALGNEIPQLFSDVIYTVREGDKFYFDTAAYGVDAKSRSLGYRSKIEPSLAAVLETWKNRHASG